jgi:hypothetical protein
MSTSLATKNGAAPVRAVTSRMTLANLTRGRLRTPLRVLIYGVEGVGKSTFAMRAPRPIFLGKENGTEELDVDRLPDPRDWSEVFEGIDFLERESLPYETLVVDPVNWLEPLCWAHVCKAAGWRNIDEPGYGKGYDAAQDEWRRFIAALERLWDARKMNVVLVAHAQVKGFNDPESADTFDRYQLAMNAKAAGLFKQWCGCVLFAKHELSTHKAPKGKRVQGVSSGARKLYTQWTPAYDAKNRYGLPESLPLSWDDFHAAVETGRSAAGPDHKRRADAARARVEALLAVLADAAYTARARAVMASAGDDTTKLAEVENRVAARVSTKKGDA